MKKLIFILALVASTFTTFAQDSVYVNKKDGSIVAYKISDVDSISFARKISTSTVTDYVVINGVKWATKNVDAPGTFAASPEASGMFYQWNSNTAWSATGTVTGWDNSWNGGFTSPSANDTWEKANDPSPAGYRVPNCAELQSLFNNLYVTFVWATQNGVNGIKFIDKTSGDSIFMPASGYRYGSDGAINYAGSNGQYWSSTTSVSYGAYCQGIGNSYGNSSSFDRCGGLAVRPVAE